MIRASVWMAALTAAILLWHECGEDAAIFCYRIGYGLFMAARSRTLALVPVHATLQRARVRNNSACSLPSCTFSIRSTTQTD